MGGCPSSGTTRRAQRPRRASVVQFAAMKNPLRSARLPLAGLLAALLFALPPPARADFADHFARRDDVGQQKAPVLGKSRLLIIPVQVDGHTPFDMAATRAFFEGGSPNGLRNFYKVNSSGRFEFDTKVLDPVVFTECPLPAGQFPNCSIQRGDINSLQPGLELLRQVFRRVDAEVDFREFDLNGLDGKPDGYADMVGIITNTSFGGIGLPVFFLNDGDNLAGGTKGPFELDGIKIATVALGGNSRNGMVMLHELGHILGLTDLYAENGSYPGTHFSAMGDWHYDYRPPMFDAETRYRLGWVTAKVVSGTVRVVLKPAADGGDVYKLGTGQEYFLVENRRPGTTFDLGIGAGDKLPLGEDGLAVYHVDRRVGPKPDDGEFISRLLQCVNCDAFHPYIRNVPSNGAFDFHNDKPFSDSDLLFGPGEQLLPDADSTPLSSVHQVASTNFYDGTQSGIRIEEIRALPDNAIEVLLTAPETDKCAEACSRGVCPQSECISQPGGPAPSQQPEEPAGCGCSSAGPVELATLAGLLAAGLLRRRRE